jgi:hypothetical protein
VGFSLEVAVGLAFAWSLVVAIAIVATQWQPRHTHPSSAQCRCIECVVRRTRHLHG